MDMSGGLLHQNKMTEIELDAIFFINIKLFMKWEWQNA